MRVVCVIAKGASSALGQRARSSGLTLIRLISTVRIFRTLSIAGLTLSMNGVGNEAPEVSVDALFVPDSDADLDLTSAAVRPQTRIVTASRLTSFQWAEVLPKVPLGPSSRHLFKIPNTTRFNHVKLTIYPDGGIVSTHHNGNPE